MNFEQKVFAQFLCRNTFLEISWRQTYPVFDHGRLGLTQIRTPAIKAFVGIRRRRRRRRPASSKITRSATPSKFVNNKNVVKSRKFVRAHTTAYGERFRLRLAAKYGSSPPSEHPKLPNVPRNSRLQAVVMAQVAVH